MHERITELTSGAPTLTDGAWGTQLQAKGLEAGACPESWNLTHAARVEEVAKAYVEAGSRVILTNTFGANRFTLTRAGLGDKVADLNRAGVEISRRAARGRAYVFASMGPTGVMLMMEEVSPDAVRTAFEEQAQALAEAGAEAIVIETMADTEEAKLAVAAARKTGLPVIVCMVFDSGKDMDRTMMGTTPEQAAQELESAGADVIGSNCGQGVEGFVSICRRLRAATDRPLWIKPNAGLPKLVGDQTVYEQTPEEFAGWIPALVDAGASFLGGCCGTSPDFIRAARAKLDEL